ncbi:MAG: RagB/SusD family nutrient uptake outer membrane protein [Ferruginibacter sp.]
MKKLIIILVVAGLGFSSCKKAIDLYPESNLNTATYYTNYAEVNAGLLAVYNSMRNPLYRQWQLTELRSDNSWMGVTGSTNSFNRDLSDLDMFMPAPGHDGIYNYWQDSYNVIRNANTILQKLGVSYDPTAGTITLADINIPISETDRKQFAGEAMFIRAQQYFSLVRLFGGVMLIHKLVTPVEAKSINRSTVAEIYKFIETDLKTAATYTSNKPYSQILPVMKGSANSWAAKALLAKVYLTQNKKAEAITLLQDVIANSGYGLQPTYASVFATSNELNSEILFAVRYKSGGIGQGSTFGNDFGPLNSGSAIINGSGLGWNTPTTELDTALNGDSRKATILASYGVGTAANLYVKKYLTPVSVTGDGESDWPVIRYADVLLLLAEAQGFTPASVALINQVHIRAGLPSLIPSITTVAEFEKALSNERRVEFAFENQRWFDLVRYNTTLTTITAQQVMKDHFAKMYTVHYGTYVVPTPTLAFIQANVTADHLLLPIPQYEIDINTQIVIPQNPGY